jgi:Gluconate 2-dehydrogenase subunit 3
MHDEHRRHVIRVLGRGGLMLPFAVNGALLHLSPAQARVRALPLAHLSAARAATLAALGEVLLPGAAAAGVVHFVDQQLGASPDLCLLMVKYFAVAPPYAAFYGAGLEALDAIARRRHGKAFEACAAEQKTALVAPMLGATLDGWNGPPAPLFYMAVRSDAVDVVYGSSAGAKALGLPTMEHILPPTPW